jgi:hypothetical protein
MLKILNVWFKKEKMDLSWKIIKYFNRNVLVDCQKKSFEGKFFTANSYSNNTKSINTLNDVLK